MKKRTVSILSPEGQKRWLKGFDDLLAAHSKRQASKFNKKGPNPRSIEATVVRFKAEMAEHFENEHGTVAELVRDVTEVLTYVTTLGQRK
jgi:hypothetical protein